MAALNMKRYLRVLVGFLFVTTLYATGQVTPGDNLVGQGIPPIPSGLVESVARYINGRDAEVLDWHPTRHEMLIATFFADIPQIHLVKFPGGARTQLTFFADNPARGVSYHPTTGDYFIFSKDVGGDQNYQIYRYDFSTGDVTLLTDGKSKNSPGIWSNSGDGIVYGSSRRNGKDVDLYIMDPSHPSSDRMLAQLEGGGWTALDWSPDDRTILALNEVSANESYLWAFDVATGRKTALTPKSGSETVFYGAGQFSRDGKGVYVTTDRSSEFQRLAYIDLQTHQYTFLTDYIKWDIQEFKLSPDGKLIGLIANQDGLTVLHLIDARTGSDIHLVNFPVGYVFGALCWHKNGRYLGFSMDSVRSPADAYALDTKTLAVERWTYSEKGTVNTDSFVEPKLVRWKSFAGLPLSGFLYSPPAKFSGKRPVIIDIHGGPEGQFQPYFQGRDNFYMNELGVAMLHPNIRGSTGYGKEFLKLDNGFLRENAYKDIGSLLDWIKTQPDLDADRVMVTGASYGGHMALVVAARFSDRIRCAIDIVGPANLVTFLENTAAYRQDLRRVEYGDERDPKMRAFLEQIAPLNNATKITKPLFVIQGMNDPIVPRSESETMVAALRKNGTPVWYLMAKDEGHGFFKKNNSDFQFYATVLFMKEYLLK
jgi:dipeptidyl aminopeptidase/acylaminoacyl peptidase